MMFSLKKSWLYDLLDYLPGLLGDILPSPFPCMTYWCVHVCVFAVESVCVVCEQRASVWYVMNECWCM